MWFEWQLFKFSEGQYITGTISDARERNEPIMHNGCLRTAEFKMCLGPWMSLWLFQEIREFKSFFTLILRHYSWPTDSTGLNCTCLLTPRHSQFTRGCSRVESTVGNPRMWRADCRYAQISDCVRCRGSGPLLALRFNCIFFFALCWRLHRFWKSGV